MNESRPAPPGMVSGLRALGDGLLASVQDRVALFGIEIEEEKQRLIQTLIWISAAIVTGVMTLVMASFTLVYLFWNRAPLAVLLGLSGIYGLLLGASLLGLRRMLVRQPRPFAASLAELEEDRTCIRDES